MAATTYLRGDFSFINDPDSVRMLSRMYKAFTETENWNNLAGFIPGDGGFMFCKKPEWLSQINKAIEQDQHSGFSYSWAIRQMHIIARHGWEHFVLKNTSTDPAVKTRLQILELPYAIQEAEATLIAWIKRLETAPDADSLDRLYCRINEAKDEVLRLNMKLSALSPSGAQEGGSHMLTDSLERIMSTVPPRPELVAHREMPAATPLPPMPPMGVPLMRSVSGLRYMTGA
jgi:hypothetical protein